VHSSGISRGVVTAAPFEKNEIKVWEYNPPNFEISFII